MITVPSTRRVALPAVTVIAPHSSRGYSMRRYAEMLHRGYIAAGIEAELMFPPDRLSRSLRYKRPAKFVAYVEQLFIFSWQILRRVEHGGLLHVADHSDALLLLFIRRRPAVVTCHDLFALLAARGEIPEHRTRWSGRIYQLLVGRGLRCASALYCVSRATEKDVKRVLPDARTRLLPNPVSSFWFDDERDEDVRFDAPYLLVVSSSGWRKRREHSVAVWNFLAQADPNERLDLVFVGPPLDERESLAVPPDMASRVSIVEAVSDVELRALYRGAVAVLQVSLYEGFGWPIVEGNAAGTPAICADLPVFHEVGGEAATFIPADIHEADWLTIRRAVASRHACAESKANARRYTEEVFAERLRSLTEEGVRVG